jgi:competence protein ComEC
MPVWLTLFLVALLAIYTVFTGASPSVVRAAIMGAVLLIAPVVGRRYDPVAALTVTAAVMLALDPDVLADGGFQLSFLAMLGIAVVSPRLSAFADRHSVPALLSMPLAVGIGAQALMWPVGAMLAGQVSLVSPLATLFADIALVPLMVSGILTAILSGVPLLAAVPGFVAWLSAEWLLICARLWGSLPLATVSVDWLTPVHAAAYYLALMALLNLRKGLALMRGVPHLRPELTLFALGTVAALTWLGAIWLLLSG